MYKRYSHFLPDGNIRTSLSSHQCENGTYISEQTEMQSPLYIQINASVHSLISTCERSLYFHPYINIRISSSSHQCTNDAWYIFSPRPHYEELFTSTPMYKRYLYFRTDGGIRTSSSSQQYTNGSSIPTQSGSACVRARSYYGEKWLQIWCQGV